MIETEYGADDQIPGVDFPISGAIPVDCECHNAVTSIREDLDNIMTIVKAIHEEVGPTLTALQNNPMLKMFFK